MVSPLDLLLVSSVKRYSLTPNLSTTSHESYYLNGMGYLILELAKALLASVRAAAAHALGRATHHVRPPDYSALGLSHNILPCDEW